MLAPLFVVGRSWYDLQNADDESLIFKNTSNIVNTNLFIAIYPNINKIKLPKQLMCIQRLPMKQLINQTEGLQKGKKSNEKEYG